VALRLQQHWLADHPSPARGRASAPPPATFRPASALTVMTDPRSIWLL